VAPFLQPSLQADVARAEVAGAAIRPGPSPCPVLFVTRDRIAGSAENSDRWNNGCQRRLALRLDSPVPAWRMLALAPALPIQTRAGVLPVRIPWPALHLICGASLYAGGRFPKSGFSSSERLMGLVGALGAAFAGSAICRLMKIFVFSPRTWSTDRCRISSAMS
jgi:hypothetical protein